MQKTKFYVPENVLWEAFEQSKNSRIVGVDGQTMRHFRKKSAQRIRRLREQLSSGRYLPSPLLRTYRPKPTGGMRALGIPTVSDHIVQTALRNQLSARFNRLFHPNSFLHLRGKKARVAALETARKRCLSHDWVLIVDIKKYGENIDHQILMSMLRKYFQTPWMLQYTQRMLKAPTRLKNGKLVKRYKGLPHDNSLSFFLADFYLHDVFDQWMKKNHPNVLFERYMDDIIIHCRSESQARNLLPQILHRFRRFKLEKNPKKTKIVYCKDGTRKGHYTNISFNFLEYSFRSRIKKSKSGRSVARFGHK